MELFKVYTIHLIPGIQRTKDNNIGGSCQPTPAKPWPNKYALSPQAIPSAEHPWSLWAMITGQQSQASICRRRHLLARALNASHDSCLQVARKWLCEYFVHMCPA
jgi:hypothetical protein